jgi:hypothetical protein
VPASALGAAGRDAVEEVESNAEAQLRASAANKQVVITQFFLECRDGKGLQVIPLLRGQLFKGV